MLTAWWVFWAFISVVELMVGELPAISPRFMARWVPPYLHDGLFNIVSTLAGFQEMK